MSEEGRTVKRERKRKDLDKQREEGGLDALTDYPPAHDKHSGDFSTLLRPAPHLRLIRPKNADPAHSSIDDRDHSIFIQIEQGNTKTNQQSHDDSIDPDMADANTDTGAY
ncbi:unnamed protein product [Nezara viridula]|uniref:Uncharacterized protein n=1 Tax=Nezara viridula TaxID=85310 RepID=A0A9P0MX81_NEZVI|nr:unnamed protein product [Nezara viridula]